VLSVHRHRRRLRHGCQAGFTLVELLVSMLCALTVSFALIDIMIVTMHQTQRTFTEVDATRQARGAFGTIENELHSACVNGSPPVQGVTSTGTVESDANDLVFVSYYGPSASPQAVWHQLSYSSSAHTLVDTSYSATYTSTSTGGFWVPTGSGTPVTLLSNLPTQPGGAVFQFYAYTAYPNSAGTTLYWQIPDGNNPNPVTGATLSNAPLPTTGGLSAANAATVVQVTIHLLVGPSSTSLTNSSLTSVDDPVNDAISLRLTTPPDSTPAGSSDTEFGPCQ
jgi:prepilin-type N-terminal cleavage/methylation domain-containing protein